MNLPKIASSIVRSTLLPVFVLSGFAVLTITGCTTAEENADPVTIAKSGVFSDEYMAKYTEYSEFLKSVFMEARSQYDAGKLSRDQYFLAKYKFDQARLGSLMLKNGKNPADCLYAFQLIKAKAMQACENEMKKFDFVTEYFTQELRLAGQMMKVDAISVGDAVRAVNEYPLSDLMDEQLEILANLKSAPVPFAASPIYISRYEELVINVTGAYDLAKTAYEAGKIPETQLIVMVCLLDEAHIGLKRLQKGQSARPGLLELFLASNVADFLHRSIQEDLHANKATYAQVFEASTEQLKREAALLKDWRIDPILIQEVSSFNLVYPRGPLSDDTINELVDIRARRAPAEGSYAYLEKYKQLVANRIYLTNFYQAEYERGKLPVETFKLNTYLWDLDRIMLARIESGESCETGYAEALMTARFRQYFLEAKKNAPKPEVNALKAKLLEAELCEIEKSQSMAPNALKTARRIFKDYPNEPLKDKQITDLLKLEKNVPEADR